MSTTHQEIWAAEFAKLSQKDQELIMNHPQGERADHLNEIVSQKLRDDQQSDTFGPVNYSYTRKQAIADGTQYDLTKITRKAGITLPVFITAAAFEHFIAVPDGVEGQNEEGRRWDILWMLRFAIHRSKPNQHRITVAFYCRNVNRSPKLHKLIAECGPLDIDFPQPAITLMMPDED